MEVWEAKGKGHRGVRKLPNFDLSSPLPTPQGQPTVPAPTREREPQADLGVPPPKGGPEGET